MSVTKQTSLIILSLLSDNRIGTHVLMTKMLFNLLFLEGTLIMQFHKNE